MTVLLTQSHRWVVKLISINRIWDLVIGEGFYSANRIQLCKNRWNLNAELQTWDTGGQQAARWKLGFVELWWEISQNQWPRKSFVKIHPRMTPLRQWQSLCICFVKLTKSFWEHFAMCLVSSVWQYLCWSGVKVTFVAVRLQTRLGSVPYQNVTITLTPNSQTRIWTLQMFHHSFHARCC